MTRHLGTVYVDIVPSAPVVPATAGSWWGLAPGSAAWRRPLLLLAVAGVAGAAGAAAGRVTASRHLAQLGPQGEGWSVWFAEQLRSARASGVL